MKVSPTVPMLDLTAQHARIRPELDAAIAAVLDHGAFVRGPEVDGLAAELAELLGVAHVIPCGNGTDALQLALMALDLPPSSEVIVPAFNYVATAEAIALLGLTPVFADVCPDTFQLDPDRVAERITARTSALMPVHLFGQGADMQPLLTLAQRHGLRIVEDNAQSIEARYRPAVRDRAWRCYGTLGDVGTTSFFPTKNLGALGDGGALFTDDDALAERLRMLANHGQRRRYLHEQIGINSRLDTLQAAVLRVKLRHLPDYKAARQAAAARYDALLDGLPGVQLPHRAPHSSHVYHQYTLRVPAAQRDALRDFLHAQHVASMIYYPVPLPLQPAFAYLGHQPGDFPVAERLCAEVLSLPMHPELTAEPQLYVAEQIRAFFRNAAPGGG